MYRHRSAEYFLGFEFRKSVFLGVLVKAAVFLGDCQINAVFLSVYVFNGIFRPNSLHQVLQQTHLFIIIIS